VRKRLDAVQLGVTVDVNDFATDPEVVPILAELDLADQ
jgi:hypothetical protein